MFKFKKEEYFGNIEYKSIFTNVSDIRLEKLSTQLKFRLVEGKGIAIYLIGVIDNGTIKGFDKKYLDYNTDIINKMCNIINAKIIEYNIFHLNDKIWLMIKIKALFDLDEIITF
jgi:GTPase